MKAKREAEAVQLEDKFEDHIDDFTHLKEELHIASIDLLDCLIFSTINLIFPFTLINKIYFLHKTGRSMK